MEKPLKFNIPLSIIIPVYNEEQILEKSLCEIYNSASSLLKKIEIIIVNDASTDSSLEIINQFQIQHPNTIKISHTKNKGFGGAIKSGLAVCRNEYALCVPVDSPVNEETLELFLKECSFSDLVISYRLERVGYSKMMLFNSWVYHLLISALFGLKLKDYNWIHLYRTSAVRQINIQADGIFMLAEVLIEAVKKQYRIVEIPVVQRQRISGTASSAKLSSIMNVLKELVFYLCNAPRKSKKV